MSRSTTFHSKDYQALTMETESETAVEVGGLINVTITPNVTLDQLYTADSNKIADQVQHEFAVNVEAEYVFIDGDLAKEWLGGSGSSQTSWEDTSDPQKFNLDYEGLSRDGSNQMDCTVDGIAIPELELVNWDDGDYMQRSFSGTGEDISNYDIAAPSA